MARSEIGASKSRLSPPPRLVQIVIVLVAGQFVIALVRISLMTDWLYPYRAVRG